MAYALREASMAQTCAWEENTAVWRPLEAWPAEQLPASLWPWLACPGSLTEKLRAAVGDAFHVRVLREGDTPLAAEDARCLDAATGTAARIREVYLCGDLPRVYARTLAVSAAGSRWLHELGTQPLGERVFAEVDTRRSPIEVALLDAAHPLYRAAVPDTRHTSIPLWARRSLLTVRTSRLLIYECFLDGAGV